MGGHRSVCWLAGWLESMLSLEFCPCNSCVPAFKVDLTRRPASRRPSGSRPSRCVLFRWMISDHAYSHDGIIYLSALCPTGHRSVCWLAKAWYAWATLEFCPTLDPSFKVDHTRRPVSRRPTGSRRSRFFRWMISDHYSRRR